LRRKSVAPENPNMQYAAVLVFELLWPTLVDVAFQQFLQFVAAVIRHLLRLFCWGLLLLSFLFCFAILHTCSISRFAFDNLDVLCSGFNILILPLPDSGFQGCLPWRCGPPKFISSKSVSNFHLILHLTSGCGAMKEHFRSVKRAAGNSP
jgi:hypothetical protein